MTSDLHTHTHTLLVLSCITVWDKQVSMLHPISDVCVCREHIYLFIYVYVKAYHEAEHIFLHVCFEPRLPSHCQLFLPTMFSQAVSANTFDGQLFAR